MPPFCATLVTLLLASFACQTMAFIPKKVTHHTLASLLDRLDCTRADLPFTVTANLAGDFDVQLSQVLAKGEAGDALSQDLEPNLLLAVESATHLQEVVGPLKALLRALAGTKASMHLDPASGGDSIHVTSEDQLVDLVGSSKKFTANVNFRQHIDPMVLLGRTLMACVHVLGEKGMAKAIRSESLSSTLDFLKHPTKVHTIVEIMEARPDIM